MEFLKVIGNFSVFFWGICMIISHCVLRKVQKRTFELPFISFASILGTYFILHILPINSDFIKATLFIIISFYLTSIFLVFYSFKKYKQLTN